MKKKSRERKVVDVSSVYKMHDWLTPFINETLIFVKEGGELKPAGLSYYDSSESGLDEAILVITPLR